LLTGRIEAVIGVDTHKQQHSAALLDALGGERGLITIVSDGGGYRQLLEWARRLEPGRRVWAVEGTGSFGAGLSSYLLEAGGWVCEVDRPDKPPRKRGAKSDQIDAVRAARQALQEEHLAQPRRRGQREDIVAFLPKVAWGKHAERPQPVTGRACGSRRPPAASRKRAWGR
jgi:transposase